MSRPSHLSILLLLPFFVAGGAAATAAEPASTILTNNAVELRETVSPQGSVHPGISCNAETLAVMREKVLQGVSPWVDYFLNQHSYAIMGSLASAILGNKVEDYKHAVEWTTVNATTPNQGRNGSIKQQIRMVTRIDKTGETVEPNLQVAEMGRDQPHAGGNIDKLLMMAKTIHFQKTNVDPVRGTVTVKGEGVSPIHLLDNRLPTGAALFAKYNLFFMPAKPFPMFEIGELRIVGERIEDYSPDVRVAYIKGYDDGTFRPDAPVTRAEFVVAANRMMKRTGQPRENMPSFSDVDASHPAYDDIMKAATTYPVHPAPAS